MKEFMFKKNKLIFKNEIPSSQINEIYEIMEMMNIPENSIYILFDDCDHKNSIQFKDKIAKYNNIRNDLWGSDLPEDIRAIFIEMKESNHSSFIWISNELNNSILKNKNETIRFFWNLTHELQHFKQDIDYCTQILKLNGLLRDFLGLEYIQLPCEFEAEQIAKRLTLSKFGEDAINEYLIYLGNLKPGLKAHLEEVKKIEIERKYPIKEALLNILKNNRELLKNIQKELDRYSSINLDKICDTQDICAQ